MYFFAVAIVTEDRHPLYAPDRNTLSPQPYIHSGLATK